MTRPAAGFRELPHTADWALEIWAADLIGLLQQAALGMYALMHAQLRTEPREAYHFEVNGRDPEMLLVAFLSELLYFTQRDDIGFDVFSLAIHDGTLMAAVEGAPLESIAKEIKAVTYHNLVVHEAESGFAATIVFDV